MRFLALLAFACILPLAPLTAAPAPKAGPPRVLVVASNKGGNWDIYLVQADTKEAKNITNHKATDTSPIWSPDGKRIAFVSDREGTPDIWTMKADGTDVQQLTKKQGNCYDLRWSPDGSRIAFVCGNGKSDDIFTVNVATGKVAKLTADETSARQPAWAPDGKKLSYSSYTDYSTFVMNADGTGKVRLTDTNGGLHAAWSPDGRQLVYAAYTEGKKPGWKVFTVNADGKNASQLTNIDNFFSNVCPQWSPDGSKISYSERVDGVLQVAVMKADGSESKIITPTHTHTNPLWSPDGRSLSYTRWEVNKTAPLVLVVSDADGANAKELLTHVGGTGEWKPK